MTELDLSSKLPEDELARTLDLETPTDMRPNLTEIGIHEIEKGVCEDTFENRRALRDAHMTYNFVYDLGGKPTGLIAARTQDQMAERRLLSLGEKKPIMVNALDHNSDYLSGVELLLSDDAPRIVPPWVMGATRKWQAQQINGKKTASETTKPCPVRCRIIKTDGIRCILWSSGRVDDDSMCRIHLRQLTNQTGEAIERARRKISQAAPHAVDVLEELLTSAEAEAVRLKAATEILDRGGIRGGQDLTVEMTGHVTVDAKTEVSARLEKLRTGMLANAARIAELEAGPSPIGEVVDAEIVEDNGEPLPDLDSEPADQDVQRVHVEEGGEL